jgi:hypothetical protein
MYNRSRLCSGFGKLALGLRAQRVEGSFAHPLDRGGIRETHVPGRETIEKRCLVYFAGLNLEPILSALVGIRTPKELAAQRAVICRLHDPATSTTVILVMPPGPPKNRSAVTGC